MRFKKAIWIEVFEYTAEETQRRSMGINKESDGMNQRSSRAFWSIDNAWAETGNPKMNTCFMSGGEVWVTPIPIIRFVILIDEKE